MPASVILVTRPRTARLLTEPSSECCADPFNPRLSGSCLLPTAIRGLTASVVAPASPGILTHGFKRQDESTPDMTDSRPIGIWRSDARKTAIEIAARADLCWAKKKKLRCFFGKLELRYIPRFCYSRFEDHASVKPYTVVAKDKWSVALVVSNSIGWKADWTVSFCGCLHA